MRLANDSEYGLSATVWTGDTARGLALARRIEVGAVNINDVFYNLMSPTVPHGGWKASGIGARFGGANGLRKYTRAQAITEPRFPPMRRELIWFPYTRVRLRGFLRVMNVIMARDIRRPLGF